VSFHAQNVNRTLIWNAFGWGIILWLIGYISSILLFAIVPKSAIGWVILPIGLTITIWVLIKRIRSRNLFGYVVIGIIWTLIAIVLDYLLIVMLFKPADGYYKFDVYLYYFLTFIVPIMAGLLKANRTAIPYG
jgi:hypothetical protein